MLLLLWFVVCVAVGWNTGSMLIPVAMFFGGMVGCEMGLRVGPIVLHRVCQTIDGNAQIGPSS